MKTIAVIGLGYVGLPLAVEFGKHRPTIGFDLNKRRVQTLLCGEDQNMEVGATNLQSATFLQLSSSPDDLREAQVFIVAVPTPVDTQNLPDLGPLVTASEMIGKVLKTGDIVIYESTVYPGATEEVCAKVLEETSGLQFNVDFFCGYSPERINPGDKINTLTTIRKITSGSTPEVAQEVNRLYQEIIRAGTYMAPSIKVAEAAKITENTQRDVNIAYMNELSCIFNLMGIDTREVLEAAGTKWNFLRFEPGLVGGHCIAVDPYYLTYKAQKLNYSPKLLLEARQVNENMAHLVAIQVMKMMIKKGITIQGANILVLGITFKAHCPDIRNTKVINIIHDLQDFMCNVDVMDPWASSAHVWEECGIMLKSMKDLPIVNGKSIVNGWDAVIVAVGHQDFQMLDFSRMMESNKVIYDVTGTLPKTYVDARL